MRKRERGEKRGGEEEETDAPTPRKGRAVRLGRIHRHPSGPGDKRLARDGSWRTTVVCWIPCFR